MIVTRGRAWRDALHRDLAQLGLEWPEADSLMEDCSVGGMDLNLYWRAQRVIREHRDMQETLFHASRIADGTSRRTLTEAAAERAAAGPGRVDQGVAHAPPVPRIGHALQDLPQGLARQGGRGG